MDSQKNSYILAVLTLLHLSSCTTTSSAPSNKTHSETTPPQEVSSPYDELRSQRHNAETSEDLPKLVVGKSESETDSDPLEFINRPIFAFNDVLYRYLLTPLAEGYDYVTPDIFDAGVSNFFSNLREPIFFVNHILQGEWLKSCSSLGRFLFNSTVGIAGIFDPAKHWIDLPRQRATFGGTLAKYGVGYGVYLVLPILGPTDLRDGSSLVFDYFTHPLRYVEDEKTANYLLVYDGVQDEAPRLAHYDDVLLNTKDEYTFIRSLHLQRVHRDAQSRRDEGFLSKEKNAE
ncbi:VacJ family lipoprotein [Oligoflexaceae bacterium]|nr:VacJ family lipoprotein [Oligoflexaceae bacterium]